jgi:hypothetical protein
MFFVLHTAVTSAAKYFASCTAAAGIEDYERAFLKDQFLASMHGLGWNDRDASIRRFARWLGFRRAGPAIDDAARSIIKGLIRDDRLESNGTQIRRTG